MSETSGFRAARARWQTRGAGLVVALGCGEAVAGRGRTAELRDAGPRVLSPEGARNVMQINANEHLPGAGTAWALLGPVLQSPRAGVPEAKRRVFPQGLACGIG